MRIGLTISAVSHVAILAVGLLSLGGPEAFDPSEIEAIPIELVPIEELSNIRLGSLDSNVIETDTPSAVDSPDAAELAQPTGNTEEDQIKPQDTERATPAPTEESAPEPQPVNVPTPIERTPTPPAQEAQPTPEPEPEPQPEPQPAPEPEPQPEPTPPATEPVDNVLATEATSSEPEVVAPTPPAANQAVAQARAAYQEKQKQEAAAKKAAAEKAQQEAAAKQAENAQEADKISDIINKEESKGSTTGSGGEKTAGKVTGRAARLSQSEKAALAAQMRKCWNPPISALEMDGLTVRLLVDLNRDGSVGGTPQVIDISIPGNVGEATASAAQRAVRRCGPYSMPADKYEEWRQVDVTFDPKDLR